MTTLQDTIDHRSTFIAQYEALRQLPLFAQMEQTVEGSPWHREDNVLVHTDMVVAEYIKLTDAVTIKWSHDDYLGAIAVAFHDVGKPASEVQKWKEDRGHYRAYHGHELLSARLWEDHAARRIPLFTKQDIVRVSWYITNHMPWEFGDDKLVNLALTATQYNIDVFCRALLADQLGRIADDQQTKNKRAVDWIAKFKETAASLSNRGQQMENGLHMWMPIAPSGAGKSTFFKALELRLNSEGQKIAVFSLDLLRHEFYDSEDYAKAYALSIKDASFESRAKARFYKMVKECAETKTHLYIDNTNLSSKRRKMYLEVAKKYGFKTVAVLLPVELKVLIERQQTRGDKCVPEQAVRQQYNSLQAPSYGEFDEITVA